MAVEKHLDGRIQHKHDTAENWDKAINFIPKAGELIVYDADANNPLRFKMGNGNDVVIDLPFYGEENIKYTAAQELTVDQQRQARENIGIKDFTRVTWGDVKGKYTWGNLVGIN